jgi:hypothetical protein
MTKVDRQSFSRKLGTRVGEVFGRKALVPIIDFGTKSIEYMHPSIYGLENLAALNGGQAIIVTNHIAPVHSWARNFQAVPDVVATMNVV